MNAEEQDQEQSRREAVEHQNVLLAISAMLVSDSGKLLFKYLFKHFEVAQPPPDYLEGVQLHGYLGFQKAGNSIFKLVSEADHKIAASLLAKIERERYDTIYRSKLPDTE